MSASSSTLVDNPYQDNPFEVLGVDSTLSTGEIQSAIEERWIDAPEEERQRLRTAFDRLTNPMERLAHELFCCPGIDPYHTPHPQFRHFLEWLRGAPLPPGFSLGLAAGLDLALQGAHVYSQIVRSGTTGRLERSEAEWLRLVARPGVEPALLHSLAVLHHRWAAEFEQGAQDGLALSHWHKALIYWPRLARSDVFWEGRRARLSRTSLWNDAEFSDLRSRFYQARVVSGLLALSERMEVSGQAARGAARCSLLHRAARDLAGLDIPEAIAAIQSALDDLASAYLSRAREELDSMDGVEPGVRRRYRPAIEQALRLLALDPSNGRGRRFVVGECCDWCEDLYVNQRRQEMRQATAMVLPHAERLAGLVAEGKSLLTDRPLLSRFYLVRGFGLMEAGATDAALDESEAALKRSAALNPANRNAEDLLAEMPLVRASAALARGQHRRALQCLEAVPGTSPRYGTARRLKAAVYNAMASDANDKEDPDRAVRYLEQAVGLAPDDPVLRQNLENMRQAVLQRPLVQAARARDAGNHDEALRLVDALGDGHPMGQDARRLKASIYNHMSHTALQAGDRTKALEYAELACELHPEDTVLQQNLAALRVFDRLPQQVSWQMLDQPPRRAPLRPAWQMPPLVPFRSPPPRPRVQLSPMAQAAIAGALSLLVGLVTWWLAGNAFAASIVAGAAWLALFEYLKSRWGI